MTPRARCYWQVWQSLRSAAMPVRYRPGRSLMKVTDVLREVKPRCS